MSEALTREPLKVLYADDDPDDLELFLEAISEINPSITCVTAHDGQQALQLLLSSDSLPSMIFLDINMPKLDGINCLKTIRSNPKTQDLKVIMYSTTLNEKHRTELQRYDAEFLSKSTSLTQLKRTLLEYLPPDS